VEMPSAKEEPPDEGQKVSESLQGRTKTLRDHHLRGGTMVEMVRSRLKTSVQAHAQLYLDHRAGVHYAIPKSRPTPL
jgi:hypothetical protein